jgi:hypothetical protein
MDRASEPAISICGDWKLQPLSHQQVMDLTCFGGNLAAPKLLTSRRILRSASLALWLS